VTEEMLSRLKGKIVEMLQNMLRERQRRGFIYYTSWYWYPGNARLSLELDDWNFLIGEVNIFPLAKVCSVEKKFYCHACCNKKRSRAFTVVC
jgi:hypothetical protein